MGLHPPNRLHQRGIVIYELKQQEKEHMILPSKVNFLWQCLQLTLHKLGSVLDRRVKFFLANQVLDHMTGNICQSESLRLRCCSQFLMIHPISEHGSPEKQWDMYKDSFATLYPIRLFFAIKLAQAYSSSLPSQILKQSGNE